MSAETETKAVKFPQIAAAGILIAILLIAIHVFLFNSGSLTEYILPILIIDGAIFLLSILSLVSILFAAFGLHDKAQALALPEGSIRAVIAIMLIVMFAILATFLFIAVSTGDQRTVEGLTKEQTDDLAKQHPELSVMTIPSKAPIYTATSTDDKGAQQVQENLTRDEALALETSQGNKVAVKPSTSGSQLFDAIISSPPNKDGVDIAKQLVVLMGTLVTAISSFYFGAKTANGTTSDATAAIPVISSLFPGEFQAGTPFGERAIAGQNFSAPTGVTLSSKTIVVNAQVVSSNENMITCKVDQPALLTAGAWDLNISFANKKSATLKNALTVV